ncbi:hypothetical protein J437_LFUL001595 [Ladona fulva]|uniref:Protein capicua homolog-like C-terminal tri-helical domain-containing protein n=1 Tax=Ladona fulva TaxID=123851 RepID=A0A8K0KLR0_LADFU|nr:hypothetical protein J437_LFUL001595 [Ladona fulva]
MYQRVTTLSHLDQGSLVSQQSNARLNKDLLVSLAEESTLGKMVSVPNPGNHKQDGPEDTALQQKTPSSSAPSVASVAVTTSSSTVASTRSEGEARSTVAGEGATAFILAPTPAQLGRAPLQRRQSLANPSPASHSPAFPSGGNIPPSSSITADVSSNNENQSEENANSSSLQNPRQQQQQQQQSQQTQQQPQASPSSKKSFFKKNVEDGMDRVLEQVNFEKKFSSLPEFKPEECQSPSAIGGAGSANSVVPSSPRLPFVPQGYHHHHHRSKKQPPTPATTSTPHRGEEEGEADSLGAPKSAKLVGGTFFGPDFNPENFRGEALVGDMSAETSSGSPRTPKTPGTSGPVGASGIVSEKGHRKVLEQRRQLVLQLFQEHGYFPSTQATSAFQASHSDVFPSKSSLQLKIREVRQKLMAQSSLTPLSAGGNSGALVSPIVTNSEDTAPSSGMSTLAANQAISIPASSSS